MGTINHNTKLVPGEMLPLILKVFIQADRGLLARTEFSGVWQKIWKIFKFLRKCLKCVSKLILGPCFHFLLNYLLFCSNRNFILMHLYGYMIGQAHICPSKCHEAKPLHIPLENIGTKYDGIHSCPLRVIDFGTPSPTSPSRCTTYIVDPDTPKVK